jgi:hypothetical protein
VAVWADANGRTGGASPSSFTQNVFGNNQSPDTFVGEPAQSSTACVQDIPKPSNSLGGSCDIPGTNVTL